MHDQKPSWQSGVTYGVVTDIGMRRANNQDSYAVALASSEEGWYSRGHLFVVADGMGAHAAGELASKMAVDTIAQTYRKLSEQPPTEAVLHAMIEANSVIHGRGEANAEFHGMGTTASVLLLLPQGAFVAHVGDSRVYRLRGNHLEQLSYDHSLLWEMISTGQIAEEQAATFVPKNIITRSLGPAARVETDREGPFPLQTGDVFLLCSDGLTGQVTDDELAQILATLEPQEAAQALVDLANLNGGPDNITVVVVKATSAEVSTPIDYEPRAPQSDGSPSHAWLWALAAAAAVVTLFLAVLQWWAMTAVSAVLVLVFSALAVSAYRATPTPQIAESSPQRHYGKAPYRNQTTPPGQNFTNRLAEIIAQLTQVASDKNWAINWPLFNDLKQQGETAAQTRNFGEAVRQYCRAMSFMMSELRKQPLKQPNA